MKKITTLFFGVVLSLGLSAQAIADQAVIPVSVTLNSIMRLQVTSGGNVEFIFSDIASYATGIAADPKYQTVFTVASSVDFIVTMEPESGTFDGEALGSSMPLNAIEFALSQTGGTAANSVTTHAAQSVLLATENIVTPAAAANNGGEACEFTIAWQCGVTNNIVDMNLLPDRYSNNIFLTLTQDMTP